LIFHSVYDKKIAVDFNGGNQSSKGRPAAALGKRAHARCVPAMIDGKGSRGGMHKLIRRHREIDNVVAYSHDPSSRFSQ
jgi:hypothetical protein